MTNDTGRGQAEAEKSHWTAGKLLAILTGITWIAIQIVIPTVGLLSRGTHPRPRPFSWQMYSSIMADDRYLVILRDRTTIDVSPRDYVYRFRREVHFENVLSSRLCQSLDNAVAVHRFEEGQVEPEVYRCQ